MNLSTDGQSIDQLIDRALTLCDQLPRAAPYGECRRRIADLRDRLAHGSLRLAVLGQFNRGKSTFINTLLGLPVLPISVLPITSVPTVIRHGSRRACTICFADERPPVHAAESLKEIERALVRFVAEENNPRNREGVCEATVYCDSAILRHGTVLIDTPGFGSTHVHNTKTTFDLLETCDAALFLFSADLPITQVEVDFLREARERVRRLFFIFNKIDLLAPEELHTTREFIGATLQREGLSPTAVRLYPVRARKARSEQEARMDDGIERVRDEIIDFMVREKYFALSEALDAKFTGAIEEITGALEEEKRSIEEPIARLRQERDALCGRIESLRAWIESQDKADEADRAELDGHIESLMADKTRLLVTGLEERLEHLLTGPLPGPAQAPLVESTFSTMLEEGLARARLEGITDVNALLRGFERERAGRLQEVYESATALLPAPPPSCDIDDSPRAEIDPAHPAPRLPAFALAPDELKKGGLFAGAEARRRRLHERLGPKLREAAEEGCADLREQLRALALERLDELEGHTTRCVGPLHESLERLHDEKAVALEEAQRAAAPRLAKTGGLLKNFGAVCGAGGSDHA